MVLSTLAESRGGEAKKRPGGRFFAYLLLALWGWDWFLDVGGDEDSKPSDGCTTDRV